MNDDWRDRFTEAERARREEVIRVWSMMPDCQCWQPRRMLYLTNPRRCPSCGRLISSAEQLPSGEPVTVQFPTAGTYQCDIETGEWRTI